MSRRTSRREYREDEFYESEQDRYPSGPRRERVFKEKRETETDRQRRTSGPPVRELERLHVREHSAPDFMRESFGPRRESEQLVLRRDEDNEEEEFEEEKEEDYHRRPSRRWEREAGRRASLQENRAPIREVEREEFVVKEDNKGRRRKSVEWDMEREEVFSERERRPRDEEEVSRRERKDDRRSKRRPPSPPEYEGDDKFHRYYSDRESYARGSDGHRKPTGFQSRSRHRRSDEEFLLRRKRREIIRGPHEMEEEEEEEEEFIEEDQSPSPELPPLREPPVVRAPSIHQEIVTHHRHIDHGYEIDHPPLRDPSLGPRSRKNSFEELEIRETRSGRRGRSSREDVVVVRPREEESKSPSPVRRRSQESLDETKRKEIMISEIRPRSLDRDVWQAHGSLRRREETSLRRGEVYEKEIKELEIVDVPPGIRRSQFDEKREESTDDEIEADRGRIARRYTGIKDKRDRLWTEITKDLVVKEAIERSGYEFEETELFYYVFSYLRYEDIAALVELSDKIRRARRRRIHEIHRERLSMPPAPILALAPPPPPPPPLLEMARPPPLPAISDRKRLPAPRRSWDEIRYKEEELVVDDGRRSSRRARSRR
ncbi:hypothetical protein ASPZODRAFT_1579904 [Penicilliopsis zonata CBS 506.65]|uniref:DUF8035 domain-containing protein n=1 Tax=Penicilliopsis zonata CBS 506.65 TaxID=1073090 RepID=A0A1L9SMD3_9EURO|nr:hypothetical protein ASPZODRAFT_1579904 [Penicilliopsis zonata CBS 506.65]OJJ48385.1 hypothetical protein ASPZODRAFT_1579904 [Penicilliopsis zonata CBS 506.65]